jgi:hypothetical protein
MGELFRLTKGPFTGFMVPSADALSEGWYCYQWDWMEVESGSLPMVFQSAGTLLVGLDGGGHWNQKSKANAMQS